MQQTSVKLCQYLSIFANLVLNMELQCVGRYVSCLPNRRIKKRQISALVRLVLSAYLRFYTQLDYQQSKAAMHFCATNAQRVIACLNFSLGAQVHLRMGILGAVLSFLVTLFFMHFPFTFAIITSISPIVCKNKSQNSFAKTTSTLLQLYFVFFDNNERCLHQWRIG